MQTFNACQTFIAFHSLSAMCDYKRGTCILNHLELVDVSLMWFYSAADTCILDWAVLLLVWLCFLWLSFKNNSSVTEDFHFMSHHISDCWTQLCMIITLKYCKTSWALYDEVVKLFNSLQLLDAFFFVFSKTSCLYLSLGVNLTI